MAPIQVLPGQPTPEELATVLAVIALGLLVHDGVRAHAEGARVVAEQDAVAALGDEVVGGVGLLLGLAREADEPRGAGADAVPAQVKLG